jgi:hypothetical protein
MVIALFALAVAMVVGGLAAIVQGYEIVLLERGWTLVISGSVFAAGGALLAGVAMAVARLGQIRTELVRTRETFGRMQPPVPHSPAFEPAAIPPALLAEDLSDEGAKPVQQDEEAQPTLPLFMRPRDEVVDREPVRDAPFAGDERPSAELPPERDVPVEPALDRDEVVEPAPPSNVRKLSLPRYLFERKSPQSAAPDEPRHDDVATVPAPEPVDGRNEPPLEPPVEVRTERQTAPAEEPGPVFPAVRAEEEPTPPLPVFPPVLPPAAAPVEREPELELPPAPPPERPAAVIGTYNSGDNRYIMFADGSIEAETPDGTFKFGSLDELKEFIAAGGEGGSRAAT